MADEFDSELQSLEEEFEGFEELDSGDLDSDALAEFQEIDELAQELGLESEEDAEPTTLAELTSGDVEGQVEIQFLGGFIKRKVKKLLKKLIKLIKKYARCRKCIPKVLKAIKLFKKRKYFAALRAAYNAYRCIKKCL